MSVSVKKKPSKPKPKIKPAGQKVPIKKRKPVWKPKPGVPSRFPKGTSGNPNGRPKGTPNKFSIAELWDAIRQVEKTKNKKKILISFVEQAYNNPTIMIALMKKLLPDLRSIEGTLGLFESTMDDDVAKAIQDKLRERYK